MEASQGAGLGFARCLVGVGRMATKFDWGQRKSGRRQVATEPKRPAVNVRIYKNRDTKAGAVSRVCLLLSRAFIDAAKLRKGDRLEACVSGGAIAVRLNAEYGVAISGAEFSQSRDQSRTTRAKSTAYAAFGAAAWPDLKAWAETRSGAWVAMINKGTHWESAE